MHPDTPVNDDAHGGLTAASPSGTSTGGTTRPAQASDGGSQGEPGPPEPSGVGGEPLRQSEERFRLMVEAVRDYGIFLLDPDGHVSSWNEGAQRIKGYTPAEIMGRHFSVFYPPEALDRGWPDYELQVARVEGRFEDEGWRLRRDGTRFWANVVITALRNDDGHLVGFAKVTRDLTERRRQEEQLRQSEERFRLMVEAVRDYGIFLLDPDGRIVSWNTGAQRIKGYTPEEAIGKHFSLFYPPEALARNWPETELELATRDGRFEEEGWRVRKDGTLFWANVVITALRNDDGRLVGFTKVTRDLTERREHEEALRESARLLEKANVELAQSNVDLQDFAHVASHDLQEPLRKISAFSELLGTEEEGLSEQGQMYVDRIQQSAVRMTAFIRGLLTYSRIARGEPTVEAVALQPIVEGVLSDLYVALEESGGRVEVATLPTVRANPTQMRQLFLNLIGNALKFHRPGVPPVVHVRAESSADTAVLVVEDNGIGFDAAHAETIFAPFHRLHSRHRFEGTGLGLAIARRIVERHGGTLRASSVPDQGSRFVICMPQPQTRRDS